MGELDNVNGYDKSEAAAMTKVAKKETSPRQVGTYVAVGGVIAAIAAAVYFMTRDGGSETGLDGWGTPAGQQSIIVGVGSGVGYGWYLAGYKAITIEVGAGTETGWYDCLNGVELITVDCVGGIQYAEIESVSVFPGEFYWTPGRAVTINTMVNFIGSDSKEMIVTIEVDENETLESDPKWMGPPSGSFTSGHMFTVSWNIPATSKWLKIKLWHGEPSTGEWVQDDYATYVVQV